MNERMNDAVLFNSSELGKPSGKLLPFVSHVRTRVVFVQMAWKSSHVLDAFPYLMSARISLPSSALQGPTQCQLVSLVQRFMHCARFSDFNTMSRIVSTLP